MAILELIEDDADSPFLIQKQQRHEKQKKAFDNLSKEEQNALLDHITSQVANDPELFGKLAQQVTQQDFDAVNVQPLPGYVCKTKVTKALEGSVNKHRAGKIVYINVCHASSIPAPPITNESDIQKALNAEPGSTYRVPLSMLRREPSPNDKDALIMDACINTQPYLRSEKDLEFRLYILELSMEYVEEMEQVQLSREFTMPPIPCVGSIPSRVLKLPKASLMTAIRAQVNSHEGSKQTTAAATTTSKNTSTTTSASILEKALTWTCQPEFKVKPKENTLSIIIPMPNKEAHQWTVDLTTTKIMLTFDQKETHDVSLRNYQVDINDDANKVQFYKRNQILLIQLKLLVAKNQFI